MSRVLSIRLPDSTLMGIIDILELQGQSILPSTSGNIVKLLTLLTEVQRANETIPIYTEEEAQALLSERLILAGRMASQRRAPVKSSLSSVSYYKKETAISNFELEPSLNSNFESKLSEDTSSVMDDISEEILAEIERQEILEARTLRSNITSLSTDIERFDVIPSQGIVNETARLSKDDPRLTLDKLYNSSDDLDKGLLCIVYANLPEDYWSSILAERLLNDIKKGTIPHA